MSVAAAQSEVRAVFMGGSVGQAVSGLIWAASAGAGTWASPRHAIVILVVGGMFIFPLTQLALRLAGGRATLDRANPLNSLAMQVAFIVPLTLPVAGAAALHHLNWFYPAVMILVGAHYLPFMFLYGMRSFGILAAALMAGGIGIGLGAGESFELGGWVTAALFLTFAVWAGLAHGRTGGVGVRPDAA